MDPTQKPTREAIERAILGGLKASINDHGPISADRLTSALKRIVGQLKIVGVDIPDAAPPRSTDMPQQPFEFKDVKWHYRTRSPLINDPNPEPVPEWITAATVTCTSCGHSWDAEPARDFAHAGVGAMRVTCPNPACKACKPVPIPFPGR